MLKIQYRRIILILTHLAVSKHCKDCESDKQENKMMSFQESQPSITQDIYIYQVMGHL